VLVRRVVSGIVRVRKAIRARSRTRARWDDAQTVECVRIVCNAAPAALAPLMPAAAAEKLTENDRRHMPSIRCSRSRSACRNRRVEIRVLGLLDAAAAAGNGAAVRLCTRHRADGGGTRKTNAADVDRRLRGDRFRGPRAALCAFDLWARRLSNWGQFRLWTPMRRSAGDGSRRSSATSLRFIGLRRRRGGVVVHTALSVRQYLMRPTARSTGSRDTATLDLRVPVRSPRTAVPGVYLASAYAGYGGYSGVVQSAGACADMILREGSNFYLTRFLDANRRPSRIKSGQGFPLKRSRDFSWY